MSKARDLDTAVATRVMGWYKFRYCDPSGEERWLDEDGEPMFLCDDWYPSRSNAQVMQVILKVLEDWEMKLHLGHRENGDTWAEFGNDELGFYFDESRDPRKALLKAALKAAEWKR